MDAIQSARELGKTIQNDDIFIKMMAAQQRSDEDAQLQEMIVRFNQIRMDLNEEIQKPDKDQEEVSRLDKSMKDLYQKIFQNENMAGYTAARNEMEQMLAFVNQIITGSAQGLDPDTIEFQESCGGDCGGCSGCS